MRKAHILGLALLAVFAFSAIAAASASAEGPFWIVLLLSPEELKLLVAGEEFALKSTGGEFKLDGPTIIQCLKQTATGMILGGDPGTSTNTIVFEECAVESARNCLAGTNGADLIELVVPSMLMYVDTEERLEALNAFFPSTGETFVEFTLKNATGAITELCGLLNNMKVPVLAAGTQVKTLENKKCGVLALVGKLDAEAKFVATLSGEEALTGAVNSSGVTEALTLNEGKTAFELIECKLSAFSGVATELGISDVTLETGDLFGWEA